MIQDTINFIKSELKKYYPENEIDSFCYLIFEHILGYNRLKIHLNSDEYIAEIKMAAIKKIVERLRNYEPIQYIIGETEFYGLKFKVTPDVLIPRQETEELVDWIINETGDSSPKILDIGTGSGCIPIALSKNIPGATVSGWDISNKALKIAAQNARDNNVTVDFSEINILKWRDLNINKTYDIIVSNPPYIRVQEKELMKPNVLENEPHLALFVSNEDPLIFYREITAFACKYLNPGGKLYFEINEALGAGTVKLLEDAGFKNIVLKKDIPGKDRMVRADI
jgi:release factor glutamine methyltransferase